MIFLHPVIVNDLDVRTWHRYDSSCQIYRSTVDSFHWKAIVRADMHARPSALPRSLSPNWSEICEAV